MSLTPFYEKLKVHLEHPVDLVINHNRTTMLNILVKKRGYAKLSLHAMFLEAPDAVIYEIAHYIRGTRCKQGKIRAFIHQNVSKLNYQHRLDPKKLKTQGIVHDLAAIYNDVNDKMFQGALNLAITWTGKRAKKARSKVTFGLYDPTLKLIKINTLLDHPKVPSFFVASVVHHEMLHHEIPYEHNKKGGVCIHGPLFKQKERAFEHYAKAKAWEKGHQSLFFK